MADFSMDYGAVANLSIEVKSIQKDFDDMLKGVESLVNSLDGKWLGAAPKEFFSVYNKLKPRLKSVNDALQRISPTTSKVVSLESETEKQTSLSFGSF